MSIGWGQDKESTSQFEEVETRTPEEVSSYFQQMGLDIGGLYLTDEDWARLEEAIYESSAARLREEQQETEERTYSELAHRGVGDSPELVAQNVAYAIDPFVEQYGDLSSQAAIGRYELQLPYNLGLGSLWYQGMGEDVYGYEHTTGKKNDTTGGFSFGGGSLFSGSLFG